MRDFEVAAGLTLRRARAVSFLLWVPHGHALPPFPPERVATPRLVQNTHSRSNSETARTVRKVETTFTGSTPLHNTTQPDSTFISMGGPGPCPCGTQHDNPSVCTRRPRSVSMLTGFRLGEGLSQDFVYQGTGPARERFVEHLIDVGSGPGRYGLLLRRDLRWVSTCHEIV